MKTDFILTALPKETFERFFALSDGQLAAVQGRRMIADAAPGFPCRVSLEDAAIGETVLLLNFRHQPADSPYQASGPIFVREKARQAQLAPNEVPEAIRRRLLSLRGYDDRGFLVGADVVEGRELEKGIARLFAEKRVAYLHLHHARPGCYACRVDRVE